MMYKKISKLDDSLITQIKIQQKEIIMDKIHESIQAPSFKFNLRSRTLLWVNVALAIVIAVIAFIVVPSTPDTPIYSFEEVYASLVSFQEDLEQLLPEEYQSESDVYTGLQLSMVNPDYTRTYDQLYEAYQENIREVDEYTHLEYVLIASEYYDIVIDVLGMYEYIPLFKWVDGIDSEYIDRLKILVHDNNHFTLSTMKEYEDYEEYNVFYIGYDEDGLFEIEHIRYDGDINVTSSDTDFYFFRIKEDTEALFMNSYRDSIHINHTSFETGHQTLVYYNDEELSMEENDYNYYVSYFDEEHNAHRSIGFGEAGIIEESYFVYEMNELLFGYYDRYVTDDTARLTFNLLEAPGWEYASYNERRPEEMGVYIGDTKLFEEDTVSVSKTYYNVYVRLHMTVSLDTISDSMLDLSDYGLFFNEGKIDLEYFNEMRVTDPSEITDDIMINNMTFEELTDKETLYSGLRSILKNTILVGGNDEE